MRVWPGKAWANQGGVAVIIWSNVYSQVIVWPVDIGRQRGVPVDTVRECRVQWIQVGRFFSC